MKSYPPRRVSHGLLQLQDQGADFDIVFVNIVEQRLKRHQRVLRALSWSIRGLLAAAVGLAIWALIRG